MFKTLFMTRLSGLWHSLFFRMSRGGKMAAWKKALIGLLAVYVVAAVFFSFGFMMYQLVVPFHMIGFDWLYFALTSTMAVVFGFVGSVFVAQGQLYEAKDNELLLSMPIKPRDILMSRMAALFAVNLLYTAIILIPAIMAYALVVPIGWVNVLIFILCMLLSALLSLALSALVGWAVARITANMKRRNLMTGLLMTAFFLGFMYLYMNLNSYLGRLIENGAAIGAAFQKAMPPFYALGMAVTKADLVNLLIFAAWCLIPFAIISVLLSKNFVKITTTRRGAPRVKYVRRELQVSSAKVALLKKEFGRFISLPMYILNCGLGTVFMVILAGALIIQGEGLMGSLLSIPGVQLPVNAIMLTLVSVLAVMNDSTAPSVSLEGSCIYLLKSMPVKASDVYFGKVMLNMITGSVGILACAAAAYIRLRLTFMEGVLFLVLPLAVQLFSALIGLVSNLLMPRFEWSNATAVIKQSGSVLVAVFGGLAVFALPVILYFAVLSAYVALDIYLLIAFGYFALLCAALMLFLKARGQKIFDAL